MAPWANAIGYQATWFAVTWSAGQGRAGWGMAACIAFVALQWLASPVRAGDARAVVCALVLGSVVEGAAAAGGFVQYASPVPGFPAPAWIVLLWAAFAMTLNHSLAWFRGRRWRAAVFAGVGAPLAYLGAARAFGAVRFADPAWQGLLWLGAAWALALPGLLRVGVPRSATTKLVREVRA